MLDQLLLDCKTAWIKAKRQKKHPFRYCTLVTVRPDGLPDARVVVLRDYDAQNDRFIVYTDARTPKVEALRAQPNAMLLFYDARKLMQLRVEVHCTGMHEDHQKYKQQHPAAQKDYTTTLPPGSPIKAMDAVTYGEQHHFLSLEFTANKIDYLRLKRPNHQRAVFQKNAGQWEGQFLTP